MTTMKEDAGANILFFVIQSIYAKDIYQRIDLLLKALPHLKYVGAKAEVLKDLEERLTKILKANNWEMYGAYTHGVFQLNEVILKDIDAAYLDVIEITKLGNEILDLAVSCEAVKSVDAAKLSIPE